MEFSYAGDPRYATLELRPTGRGSETVEVRPARCPNGHGLVGRNVQVAWSMAPDGLMHRSWTCQACWTATWGI